MADIRYCPCCLAPPSEPHNPRCCGQVHHRPWPHDAECSGCGASFRADSHVYGEKKCCPDCSHYSAASTGSEE